MGCMARYRPTSSNRDDIAYSDTPWPRNSVLGRGDEASLGLGFGAQNPPKHGFVCLGQTVCNSELIFDIQLPVKSRVRWGLSLLPLRGAVRELGRSKIVGCMGRYRPTSSN